MRYRHTASGPGKGWSYHFDSLAELGRYIDDTPRTWRGCTSSEARSYGEGWDLGATYAQTVEYAKRGWIEGAKRAQEALRVLTLQSPAPSMAYAVQGFRVSVGRVCAGHPKNMVRDVPGDLAMGRVIALYVPCNAIGSVDAKYMANFGLGVAQYINQLETDGTRVELYGVVCSDQRATLYGGALTHSWKIKSADQPLDLAVVAFSIGHPAMFRRLGFALRERSAAPANPGYGSSRPARLADLIDPPPGAYILNGMSNADKVARTPKEAVEYVTKQLDKMLHEADAA